MRMGYEVAKKYLPDSYEDSASYKKHIEAHILKATKYVELQVKYEMGDPAGSAYEITKKYPNLKEWAEQIIKNAKTGDPAWCSFLMVQDCDSDREWAEKVIENARTGDPAHAAYQMARRHGSDREWAEGIIENARAASLLRDVLVRVEQEPLLETVLTTHDEVICLCDEARIMDGRGIPYVETGVV